MNIFLVTIIKLKTFFCVEIKFEWGQKKAYANNYKNLIFDKLRFYRSFRYVRDKYLQSNRPWVGRDSS